MNCPSLNKDKRGGLTSSGVFMTNDRLKSCSLSRLDHQIDQQNNILSIDLQLYFLKLTMTRSKRGKHTDSSLIVQNPSLQRGIQNKVKNLFLIFFGNFVFPNRKMRKPFFIKICRNRGDLFNLRVDIILGKYAAGVWDTPLPKSAHHHVIEIVG